MSREHKAYTYLRIYTLKYKNACIVYYVAVFLGYQVKTKKKLYKTFVEIFSHMPIMYRVTLDMAGFALRFRKKKSIFNETCERKFFRMKFYKTGSRNMAT